MNSHISDREMQEHIEGEVRFSNLSAKHISECSECADNLEKYHTLLLQLQEKPPYALSENFTNAAVRAVFSAKKSNIRSAVYNFIAVLFLFIGVIAITQHYIDLKPAGKKVAGSMIPNFNLSSDQAIAKVKKPVMSLKDKINFKDNKFLVYAGIVILLMYLIERAIVNRYWRYRGKVIILTI